VLISAEFHPPPIASNCTMPKNRSSTSCLWTKPSSISLSNTKTCSLQLQEWSSASFDALPTEADSKGHRIHLPSPEPLRRQDGRVLGIMRSARRRTADLSRRLMHSGTSLVSNKSFSANTPITATANVYGANVSMAGRNYRWKMTGQAGSLTCMAPEVRTQDHGHAWMYL
jgi:hypothetical protein